MGLGQSVTAGKTLENHTPRGGGANTTTKVKPDKPQTRKPEGFNEKEGPKDEASNQNAALQDSVVCLTNEQLQQILSSVQTNGQSHSSEGNQNDSKSESIVSETNGTEEKEAETGISQEKDKSSGGLFRWMEVHPSEDRAKMEAKKTQWRRELDKQVSLKQKQSKRSTAPPRLQAEENTESLVYVQSSVSHKEPPAAIKSNLRLGEFTPMEEAELTVERREEQRRRWLEELDKQREETTERRRLEKLQQRQTEDQEQWASHFDSLQRRPLAAPILGPGTERLDLDPSSSLSLWEEAPGSSCGGDSVRSSVEMIRSSSSISGGQTTRASYLRTMTSLLDPTQIQERERRRLKQLEQQRAIKLQMEERRRRREEEEAQRRREEEEEERRVASEREQLQRRYDRDAQRERVKEPKNHETERDSSESSTAPNQEQSPEEEAGQSAVNLLRDTAVQTEACVSLSDETQTSDADLKSVKSRGKENICGNEETGQTGLKGDTYQEFARTQRNRKDKKRPEWNTQRPSRRFVPASQRYPEELQKHRQQSRLKRQAQLLSLQKNRNQTGPEPHRGATRVETAGQSTHRDSPAPDLVPYVRTEEVFDLSPTHAPLTAPVPAAPQLLQKTQRQQEILRGLAQLRQGLLQKQRELESDLSRSRQRPQTRLHSSDAPT